MNLDQKPREKRYREAADRWRSMYLNLAPPNENVHVRPIEDFDALLALVVQRSEIEQVHHWRGEERSALTGFLASAASRAESMHAVRPVTHEDPPVAIEAAVRPLVENALGGIATRASDLLLAAPDGGDGLCVELNAAGADLRLEAIAWGHLRQ